MERLSQSNVVERTWQTADAALSGAETNDMQNLKDKANSSHFFSFESVAQRPVIWAIGSGKGGVGKSLLSASLAVSFAKKGLNVLAVDLDIGGSNLHTCLGVDPPKIGLGDWASGRVVSLERVSVDTDLPNLKLISGANDSIKITQLIRDRSTELIQQMHQLPVDHVIIDLGAGTYDATLDFFMQADQGVISILPEPTSVENAYRFIRSVIFRKLKACDVPTGIREVIEASSDPKNVLGIKTPHDLIAVVSRLDQGSADLLKQALEDFQPSIVVNQVRSQVDVDVGKAIQGVCRRFFGIDVSYPGYIDHDAAVWKAVRNRRPAILEFPRSVLANRIAHLSQALLDQVEDQIEEDRDDG